MMNNTTLTSNSCCTVPIEQKPIDSRNGVKKKGDFKSTITAVLSGLLASSCCVIPLVVILTGVGGVGFMALARDYQWLTLPFGTAILGYAYYSYFKNRKSCTTGGCEVKRTRINLVTLILSTLVVSFSVLGVIFPSMIYALLKFVG